jgi:CHAT domain-containing protein/tetratricopeptide (TPR) repeat protein
MDAQRPCPDAALLAAFLDGNLADYERTAVVTHLTDCAQCRAVALAVVEFHEIRVLDELWEKRIAPAAPPRVTAGALRWSREKTRAPALVGGVAAVALALGIYFFQPSPLPASAPQPSADALTDVVHRPLEGRLSGAAAYAPPPSADLSQVEANRPPYQLIRTAETEIGGEPDAARLSRRSLGLAALLVGDLDEAIATLEIAAAADPGDAQVANDLSAAYYERSQRADRPDDLPAALSSVERVLAGHPANLEALFNRALIISALGLRAEAGSAWRDYIARDPDSAWAREARERWDATKAPPSPTEWASVRQALESANGASAAESAVRHHASATREYIESELLGRWVTASKGGNRAAADEVLARVETLGWAFAAIANDDLYRDLVIALQRSRAEGRNAASVTAHETYLRGMALMARQSFAEAAPVLRRAQRQLSAVDSPLTVRAQIELSATHYYALRYRDALISVAGARRAAQQRRHAILVTRGAWVDGLAAFGLNDFARAQVSYEEMLASAIASGDADPSVMARVLLANLHDMLGNGPKAWQHRVTAGSQLQDVFSLAPRLNHLISAAGDAHAGGHYSAAVLFQSLLLSSGDAVPAGLAVQVHAQRARSLELLRRRAEASLELQTARRLLATVPDGPGRGRVEADVLAAEAEIWSGDDPEAAGRAARRALTLPIVKQDHLRRARVWLHLASASIRDSDLAAAQAALEQGFDALDRFRDGPAAEFAIRASDPVWRLYDHAAQIALRRGDLAGAFLHIERRRMRTPQERRAWGAGITSLNQVQNALAPDTALAVLTQLEDRLQIWMIRRDDVSTRSVAITPDRAAALVAAQLDEMRHSRVRPAASAQLFDAIFQPVAQFLDSANRIVVVADAPYDRIAYAGLWDDRGDRFVVEDHGVVLAPNATAFVMSARRSARDRRAGDIQASIVTAAATPGSGHRQAALAESLAGLYGAGRTNRTDAATAADLVGEVTTGDVVHISAQVVPNDDFPALSHIELADAPDRRYSGAVFGRSVANARAHAQLVALEGGPPGRITPRTEGAFGFARALVAAGVLTVVSPVADIEPGSVDRIWLDFHRHYAEGTAAVESLRRAQLAALGTSDRRPGPWATLTVFGSTQ